MCTSCLPKKEKCPYCEPDVNGEIDSISAFDKYMFLRQANIAIADGFGNIEMIFPAKYCFACGKSLKGASYEEIQKFTS